MTSWTRFCSRGRTLGEANPEKKPDQISCDDFTTEVTRQIEVYIVGMDVCVICVGACLDRYIDMRMEM